MASPSRPQVWGVTWDIQEYAVRQYYLHKAYPDRFDRENLLRVLNYVLGCHPASDTSLVSAVGAKSMTVAYGINLNDWTHIPGGGVSGPSLDPAGLPRAEGALPVPLAAGRICPDGRCDLRVHGPGGGQPARRDEAVKDRGYRTPSALCFSAILSARASRALNSASRGRPLAITGGSISALIFGMRPDMVSTILFAQP